MCPAERRAEVWRRLGETIDADALESMTSEVTLGELPALAGEILAGRTRGRVVVRTAEVRRPTRDSATSPRAGQRTR